MRGRRGEWRAGLPDRRAFALGGAWTMGAAMLGARGRAFAEVSGFAHAIAMHGAPALPDGFAHFPYADPMARRGGRLTLGVQGTFDSLNPLIVQGNASDASAALRAAKLDDAVP